jgi:chromosome segregation ATPase
MRQATRKRQKREVKMENVKVLKNMLNGYSETLEQKNKHITELQKENMKLNSQYYELLKEKEAINNKMNESTLWAYLTELEFYTQEQNFKKIQMVINCIKTQLRGED